MVTLEITIPIASPWPTREDLIARNAVEAALKVTSVGRCTGAGGGMGQMDLAYCVDDTAKIPAARAVIDDAMKAHMPSFKYQIRYADAASRRRG